MPIRSAEAQWKGSLKDGEGKLKLESGAFEGKYSFQSRFEEGAGTNPEELIGAAHSGCFAMALSNLLEEEGYLPEQIDAEASVKLEKTDQGFEITAIKLTVKGKVPGLDEETFKTKAEDAKNNCPVSKMISPEVNVSLESNFLG